MDVRSAVDVGASPGTMIDEDGVVSSSRSLLRTSRSVRKAGPLAMAWAEADDSSLHRSRGVGCL